MHQYIGVEQFIAETEYNSKSKMSILEDLLASEVLIQENDATVAAMMFQLQEALQLGYDHDLSYTPCLKHQHLCLLRHKGFHH